jgi:hypothetical protein
MLSDFAMTAPAFDTIHLGPTLTSMPLEIGHHQRLSTELNALHREPASTW